MIGKWLQKQRSLQRKDQAGRQIREPVKRQAPEPRVQRAREMLPAQGKLPALVPQAKPLALNLEEWPGKERVQRESQQVLHPTERVWLVVAKVVVSQASRDWEAPAATHRASVLRMRERWSWTEARQTGLAKVPWVGRQVAAQRVRWEQTVQVTVIPARAGQERRQAMSARTRSVSAPLQVHWRAERAAGWALHPDPEAEHQAW